MLHIKIPVERVVAKFGNVRTFRLCFVSPPFGGFRPRINMNSSFGNVSDTVNAAHVLQRAADLFGGNDFPVLAVANHIGSSSESVLTCTVAADSLVVFRSPVAAGDDHLGAIQLRKQGFKNDDKLVMHLDGIRVQLAASYARKFVNLEVV